jgi:hypothetical protein
MKAFSGKLIVEPVCVSHARRPTAHAPLSDSCAELACLE